MMRIRCKKCETELLRCEPSKRHAFIFKGVIVKGYLVEEEKIKKSAFVLIDENLFYSTDQSFDQELVFKFLICSTCKGPLGKLYVTCNRRMKYIKNMAFIHSDCTKMIATSITDITASDNADERQPDDDKLAMQQTEADCQLSQTSIDFECLLADVDQCLVQSVEAEIEEYQQDTTSICTHIQAQGNSTVALMASVNYSKELLHAIIDAYRTLCTLIAAERSTRN